MSNPVEQSCLDPAFPHQQPVFRIASVGILGKPHPGRILDLKLFRIATARKSFRRVSAVLGRCFRTPKRPSARPEH